MSKYMMRIRLYYPIKVLEQVYQVSVEALPPVR